MPQCSKRWRPSTHSLLRMLGWRRLDPKEVHFLATHFGAVQAAALAQHLWLGVRRVGDTRRAMSLGLGWVSLPKACFEEADPAQALRVEHPVVAGVFAHEVLHALQRQVGMRVTWPALLLQMRWLCGGHSPYVYFSCEDARAQLRAFWQANVEQQGQMWQDHVQRCVAGSCSLSSRWMVQAVQSGRLRRKRARKFKGFGGVASRT